MWVQNKRGLEVKKLANFAGSFYPDNPSSLMRFFDYFDEIYSGNFEAEKLKPKIVIAPHAGYVYSGFTASTAYKALKNSTPKTVVVIAPSHKVLFDGFSICNYSSFATPLGDIESDLDLIRSINKRFSNICVEKAHIEHSSEVHFPFIKHYLNGTKIVEIIYSNINPSDLAVVIEFILDRNDIGIVISSDLSHFYDEKTANYLDIFCIEAIKNQNIDLMKTPCEACGARGIVAAINCAKKYQLKPKILDYRTSAEASGDKSSVVGYLSAYFY